MNRAVAPTLRLPPGLVATACGRDDVDRADLQFLPSTLAVAVRDRRALKTHRDGEQIMDLSVELPSSRPIAAKPARVHTEDCVFLDLLRAYRRRDGLARESEVANLARERAGLSAWTVAGWIVHEEVLSFYWGGHVWLPLFQFHRDTMTPRAEVIRVCRELRPAFDGWSTAGWFVEPNALLGDKLPADVIAVDPAAVLRSARADRFIITG